MVLISAQENASVEISLSTHATAERPLKNCLHKTLSRELCVDGIFALEEPGAKSNRFLNEVRLNHDIRYLNMDERPDFWETKRRMKGVMDAREERNAITRNVTIRPME